MTTTFNCNSCSRSLPIITLLFCLAARLGNAANILNLMSVPSPSHHIWHKALIDELAARGHNITVLSTGRDSKPPANVTYLHLDVVYAPPDTNLAHYHNATALESVSLMWQYSEDACASALQSIGVRQLLAYPSDGRFSVDAILYDYTAGPCLLGFQHKFGMPVLIAVTPFNMPEYTADFMGAHNYAAYVPMYAMRSDGEMTFIERVQNLFLHGYEHWCRHYRFLPAIQSMADRVFGPDLPNLHDLERTAQLALVNTHPAVDFFEPLPPNIIPVGGLQVQPAQPLPDDLDSFIRNSRRAAVLFSLGTNVRSEQLGIDKLRSLLKAFARMPDYNILWKFERTDDDKTLLSIPPNVLIRAWLPQNDILGHPRVRAFITHAGTLSAYEATWHGVPMVAIPFIIDQMRTSVKLVGDGVAELLRYDEIDANTVEQKLRTVLEDVRYAERMAQRSRIYRDQPEPPLQRAVWWVEWMLRNKGAPHLRSPVHRLGAFAANSGDIWACTALLCVMLTVAVCLMLKCLRMGKRTKSLAEKERVKKFN